MVRARQLRILLANQPRAYRDTIAEALRSIFPDAGVCAVEPEALDAEVESFSPDVVVCDQASEAVRRVAVSWVELYPSYGSHSVVCVGGERETVEEMQFTDLISVVEEAARLRPSQGGQCNLS